MTELCQVLRVSVSGYYAWKHRPESKHSLQDQILVAKIKSIHEDAYGSYGSPRIHQALKRQGESISRKRVIRLMQAHGIKASGKRRFKATTYSKHKLPVADTYSSRTLR